MIEGVFRDGHPWVSVTLPGMWDSLEVEFLVDTGFADELSLPPDLTRGLNAIPMSPRWRQLADGSVVRCPALSALLDWAGEEREVVIFVLEGQPLLGMELLHGMHLHVEIGEGGQVLIEST